MTTQKQIDYVPHSRPKKYFIVLSQFRSGVGWTTFSDVYRFPGERFIPWRGLAIMFSVFALAMLALHYNWLEFLGPLFRVK